MLLLYLLLYQAKELGTAVPEGHVAGLGGYVNYRGTPLLLWLWSWPGTHGIFGVGVAVGSGFSLGAGLSLGLGLPTRRTGWYSCLFLCFLRHDSLRS